MMNRRRFMQALGLGGLACLGAGASAADRQASETRKGNRRPNVLFIAVDDLNDWVGCMGGHPQARTPHIDRLAKSGVLFTNAFCPAPACNPSRSAIMTGIPPHRSGLYDNRQKMRKVLPKAELMPKYFSRHGYWSAGSGKMLHYFIDAASWDDYFPPKQSENPFPRTFYPTKRPVSLPREPWMYVESDWAGLEMSDKEYGGDYLVAEWVSTQLLRRHDKPFFLACGIYRPHEPWFVPRKYFDMFPLNKVAMPPGVKEGDLDDVPPAGRRLGRNRYLAHIKKHGKWREGVRAYLAAIAFADAMVGRVIDTLDRSAHAGNTIVVLWSDHGWHLGEKEHWQKFTGWRVCARVPLIIRVPAGVPGLAAGTTAGGQCTRPVNLADLFKTLVDLCGLPAKRDIFGHSLLPLLRNPKAPWPHPALTHLSRPESYAITTERWRYIHYHDGGEELYDIEADPYEWTNLAGRPAHAGPLERMRALAPKDVKAKVDTGPDLSKVTPTRTLTCTPALRGPCPPSKVSSKRTVLVIENSGPRTVSVYWIDAQGKRRSRGQLPPARRRRMTTYAGHSWLFVDDRGKPIGHVVATAAPARVSIPPAED